MGGWVGGWVGGWGAAPPLPGKRPLCPGVCVCVCVSVGGCLSAWAGGACTPLTLPPDHPPTPPHHHPHHPHPHPTPLRTSCWTGGACIASSPRAASRCLATSSWTGTRWRGGAWVSAGGGGRWGGVRWGGVGGSCHITVDRAALEGGRVGEHGWGVISHHALGTAAAPPGSCSRSLTALPPSPPSQPHTNPTACPCARPRGVC